MYVNRSSAFQFYFNIPSTAPVGAHQTFAEIKMRTIIHAAWVIALMSILSGCATHFMQDRKNDATDIFSATVGYGAGAKARVGPINVGLLFQEDNRLGFKNGCYLSPKRKNYAPSMLDMTCTLISYEKFSCDFNSIVEERGKFYETRGYGGLTWAAISGRTDPPWNKYMPYYTQIDAVVAPGGAVRLGFNPGELLDFILGWTTVDIFADDIPASKQRTETNKVQDAPR